MTAHTSPPPWPRTSTRRNSNPRIERLWCRLARLLQHSKSAANPIPTPGRQAPWLPDAIDNLGGSAIWETKRIRVTPLMVSISCPVTGYQSQSVNLGNRQRMDNPDVWQRFSPPPWRVGGRHGPLHNPCLPAPKMLAKRDKGLALVEEEQAGRGPYQSREGAVELYPRYAARRGGSG